jgi:hypothetical protein
VTYDQLEQVLRALGFSWLKRRVGKLSVLLGQVAMYFEVGEWLAECILARTDEVAAHE